VLAVIETMNKAFKESFFLSVQNNDKALAKDLVAAQIKSALEYGELWVVQLTEPQSDELGDIPIIGAACWYGRGQLMPRGDDNPNSPWEQNMHKLDVGQPLIEFHGKMKSKGRIWWDKFYDAFDEMTDTGLGLGTKKAGYHLQLFGVHPKYQRQGVGTALDKAVESSVRTTNKKSESTIMCLEAVDAENVAVYEKMGYSIASHGIVPAKDSGEQMTIPFVCMKKNISA